MIPGKSFRHGLLASCLFDLEVVKERRKRKAGDEKNSLLFCCCLTMTETGPLKYCPT